MSCMILDVEDIHSVMHHKYKLFTVLDYARKFGNAAKKMEMDYEYIFMIKIGRYKPSELRD